MRNVSSFGIALIYTCLGEKDQAFRWLERVYQERESANRMNVYPQFDSLRDDPRFHDLLRRMNLEP